MVLCLSCTANALATKPLVLAPIGECEVEDKDEDEDEEEDEYEEKDEETETKKKTTKSGSSVRELMQRN